MSILEFDLTQDAATFPAMATKRGKCGLHLENSWQNVRRLRITKCLQRPFRLLNYWALGWDARAMIEATLDPPSLSPESDRPLSIHDRCAQEQVQIIGRIQSHGLLFALSEPDLIVRQVSANVSTVLGIPPEDVLGRSIGNVLGAQQFETFQSQLLDGPLIPAMPVRLPVGNSMLETYCIAHRQQEVLIVEFEFLEGVRSER